MCTPQWVHIPPNKSKTEADQTVPSESMDIMLYLEDLESSFTDDKNHEIDLYQKVSLCLKHVLNSLDEELKADIYDVKAILDILG